MHRWITGLVVAVTTAAVCSAQTLYIPASANAEGVNQTRWRTDLQVKATNSEPAAFTIELLESRQNNSDPAALDFTVAAGESLRLVNLVETEFGFTGTAALRITATEGQILATSRTYNDDPSGTYGQTVPAVADSDGIRFGNDSILIQLSRSPDPSTGFRTNIGLVNLTDQRIDTTIDLFRADGSFIATLSYVLKAFEHRQVNDGFGVAGADDVDDGYAVVRTTDEGGRFITYASVVDNGSGDAVFILGQVEAGAIPPQERLVVFESFMRPG